MIENWQIESIKYAVVSVAAVEGLLFISFVVLTIVSDRGAPFSSDGLSRTGNIYQGWVLPTLTKANFLGKNSQEAELMHQDAIATFLRGKSDALVVGGLGLTAWAVLVTQASTNVGSSALRLLLFGVAVTLVAPCLIRSGPSEGSYLSLSALGTLGFIAVLFAVLLGSANYFKIGWYSSLVTALAPIVAVTVLAEAVSEFQRLKSVFRAPASSDPDPEHLPVP